MKEEKDGERGADEVKKIFFSEGKGGRKGEKEIYRK